MTRIALDLTPLILSAVCVAENEGNPTSASDLVFMLDLPQSAIDLGLSQLVSKGSISKDGDLFRYDLRRELTTSELPRSRICTCSSRRCARLSTKRRRVWTTEWSHSERSKFLRRLS